MPTNPYSEDEIKRQAQVGMLAGPAPSGWDQGNWDDPNMHSVKYDAGRLLYGKSKPSDVAATVSGADFQKRFPGATFNGKDWLDFNGALSDGDKGTPVNGIDVLMAADQNADTSNGIWWGAPDGSPDQTTAQGGPPAVDPRMDNSALAKIMAELNAASTDDPSPAEREAMLAMLQGL